MFGFCLVWSSTGSGSGVTTTVSAPLPALLPHWSLLCCFNNYVFILISQILSIPLSLDIKKIVLKKNFTLQIVCIHISFFLQGFFVWREKEVLWMRQNIQRHLKVSRKKMTWPRLPVGETRIAFFWLSNDVPNIFVLNTLWFTYALANFCSFTMMSNCTRKCNLFYVHLIQYK